MTSNLPKMSSRARKALAVLSEGGEFRHGLERNSYTGREQFRYSLRLRGSEVRGFGHSTFHELHGLGLLASSSSNSVARYFKLATS